MHPDYNNNTSEAMRKLSLVAIILLSFHLHLSAQTAKDLEANKRIMNEVILDRDNNVCAQGNGETYEEAFKNALQNLSAQIYSRVESQSLSKIVSTNTSGKITEEVSFTSDFKSTTTLDLTGHQTLLIEMPNKKNKRYTIFAYIDAKKAKEILEEQKRVEEEERLRREEKFKNDVNFYYNEGLHSLSELSIGNALKFFYCGYILSSGSEATIERNSSIQPAEAVFTQLLDETLNGISIVCESEEEEHIDKYQTSYTKHLGFYYGNPLKKLDGLDFKYNDGNTYINGARVRDGISTAELRYNLDHFDLQCIYQCSSNELPNQIQEILESKLVKPLSFSSADKVVQCQIETNVAAPSVPKVELADEPAPVQSLSLEYDTLRYDSLTNIMYAVEKAIRNKDYSTVEPYFTDNGLDCFDKLVRYGNASIIGVPANYDFIRFGELVICRSIAMQFRFKNNKKFVENVTFRFNNDNKIESLAFTLTETAQHDILDNEDWSQNSKITLLSFMEDYQTAYALGRIEYLEQIFSENALIISGYKVMKKNSDDGIKLRNYTRLDTLSKSQYMAKLRRHFNTKEYINLNFTETNFDQASGMDDFFGIRVRQEYYSSNYGDVGYLFLLVDLREDLPVIHVRAWQEDRLPLGQLFSLKNVY